MSSDVSRQAALPSFVVLPLIMEEWLSASHFPTVICDAQQRVLWHSASLPTYVEGLTCIRMEWDHLGLSDKRAQAALSQFFQSADAPTAVIALEAEHHGKSHVLQCRRLRGATDVTAFGLRIICDDGYRESAVLHFDEYYGLTRQETLICRALLRGKTVQEIVEAVNKSSDTIRFHIRNIYQKVDVCSREALLAKLRLFLFD